ncbi:recombination regulator RecX [Pelomicrobium sp. G1]|uniref:recombination regulator RecX n=1 Tax=unclassified Pelomicrobium TaxID=2815318 RepID=UPI003F7676C4
MAATLRDRALRLLARREHTRAELKRKLAPHADEEDDLEALLDCLEREGWLSERRYVEQLLASRGGRYGSLRIAQELKEKGVAGPLAEAALSEARRLDEASCRAVWAKKFGRVPRTPAERARQARFLQSRGFSLEAIGKVLKGPAGDE